MDFKTILEAGNLEGKRVLVRVDWNVPLENGAVADDFRIQKSLPTIQYLQKAGAKVTLISHHDDESESLESVVKFVQKFLPLTFNEPSDLCLLPNLRMDKGEVENSRDFAVKLATNMDIFVNEAFSESHREYASIVGLPKLLPSYAGLQFTEEVKQLSNAFYPKHPFLLILGGAKFETKLPLINKFLNIADSLFIAGTNAKPASEADLRSNPKVIFPHGDITALDVDAETLDSLKQEISKAKMVLWNGPLGAFEQGYKEGTLELAKLVANSEAETIVGGGDTLASIKELNLLDKFSFVSTGGGAMLAFLSVGTLPGIEALKRI
jgi:phosphoglycerate kinase